MMIPPLPNQCSMNFPGHRYLGPGNSSDNGEPVDSDDTIARDHDIAYERATSTEHIRAADREAISKFSVDAVRNRNWHSAVGAVGLGAKYVIESVTGVQYPRNMSGKRTAVGSSDGERSTKQARIEDTEGYQSNPPDREEEEDDKVRGIGETHTTSRVHKALSEFKTGKLLFRHTRLVTSCGYAYKCIKSGRTTPDNTVQYLVTTPYAYVPCDKVPWYLSPAEFTNLPITSSVKRVTTICTPMGYRTPFVTNSASINYVNSDLLVIACSAYGLCNKFNGINCSIKSDTGNPMLPTEVKHDSGLAPDHWYGPPAEKTELKDDYIPCAMGNHQPLQAYYVQNYDADSGNSKAYPSVPELMQNLNLFPIDNANGGEPVSWEYRPQLCVLKPAKTYVPYRSAKSKFSLNVGQKPIKKYEMEIEVATHGVVHKQGTSTELQCIGPYEVPYKSLIEHVGSVSHGLCEYGGGLAPPSLHIGILPVHSWISSVSNDNVQPTIAIWKCDSLMEVEYSYDFTHSHGQYVPPVCATFGNVSYINADTESGTYLGYKTHITD